MALNTKTIKRRIKSIANTKKITKAMEMISAVKMRRAVANVQSSRNYSTLAWQMLTEVAKKTNIDLHPLLSNRPVKKIGLILVTSNRGLAGGFGSRLLQATHNYIKEEKLHHNSDVEVIVMGKHGKKIYHKFGHTVVAEFEKIDLTTKIEEILPMTRMAINEYIEGKIDRLVVAYTDFVSALTQTPSVKQILPIINEAKPVVEVKAEELFEGEKVEQPHKDIDETLLFEPNPKDVVDILLPRLVEMQIYQAILESDASEHSARMMAMKNASEAAGDMIKELNNSFNKARQAAITQEISEIVGGAAALE